MLVELREEPLALSPTPATVHQHMPARAMLALAALFCALDCASPHATPVTSRLSLLPPASAAAAHSAEEALPSASSPRAEEAPLSVVQPEVDPNTEAWSTEPEVSPPREQWARDLRESPDTADDSALSLAESLAKEDEPLLRNQLLTWVKRRAIAPLDTCFRTRLAAWQVLTILGLLSPGLTAAEARALLGPPTHSSKELLFWRGNASKCRDLLALRLHVGPEGKVEAVTLGK